MDLIVERPSLFFLFQSVCLIQVRKTLHGEGVLLLATGTDAAELVVCLKLNETKNAFVSRFSVSGTDSVCQKHQRRNTHCFFKTLPLRSEKFEKRTDRIDYPPEYK